MLDGNRRAFCVALRLFFFLCSLSPTLSSIDYLDSNNANNNKKKKKEYVGLSALSFRFTGRGVLTDIYTWSYNLGLATVHTTALFVPTLCRLFCKAQFRHYRNALCGRMQLFTALVGWTGPPPRTGQCHEQ